MSLDKISFIFFDVEQTLVDEWDFIRYLDRAFLELLNGFGARMDMRAYQTLRDSVIRDRLIRTGGIQEVILQVAGLALPAGNGKAILRRLEPELAIARRQHIRLFDVAKELLGMFAQQGFGLGIIYDQGSESDNTINGLLQDAGIMNFFKVRTVISGQQSGISGPETFELAVKKAGVKPQECIVIGDRLDTNIAPAKITGMKTIRVTDSLFSVQEPRDKYEMPDRTVSRLSEIIAPIRNEGDQDYAHQLKQDSA